MPVSLKIDHGGGWFSYVTHLANTTVDQGSNVTYSTNLGNPSCYFEEGGSATGRHVHVGLIHDSSQSAIFDTSICGWTVSDTSPYVITKGSVVAYPLGNAEGQPRGIISNDNCPEPPPPLKVLVAGGMTSNSCTINSDSSAPATCPAGEQADKDGVVTTIRKALGDQAVVEWLSYVDGVDGTDANAWQEPYTKADTCRGVSNLGANVEEAIDAAHPDTRVVLVGHSLGGFAIAKWASGASATRLGRVSSIVTLDSPLNIDTFGAASFVQAAMDALWRCSVRDGDNDPGGFFPGCGFFDEERAQCRTYNELTSDSIQNAIGQVPRKVPFAAFDCRGLGTDEFDILPEELDGDGIEPKLTPCLNTVEELLDEALIEVICEELAARFPNKVTIAACLAALVGTFLTGVDTDLDGTWRYHGTNDPFNGHDFYRNASAAHHIADSIKTRLIEIGQTAVGPLCTDAGHWAPDQHAHWINGAACRTDDTVTTEFTVPQQEDVLAVRLVYGGDLSAEVKIGNGQWIDLAPTGACAVYPYHTRGAFDLLGKELCWWYYAKPPSEFDTVTIRTEEKCALFLGCRDFVLDGVEVLYKPQPPDSSGGGGGPTVPADLISREGDTLWINVGPRASLRNVATSEVNETVTVAFDAASGMYVAEGFGQRDEQAADGISLITGDGASGNDALLLENVSVRAELHGGDGADMLTSGSAGDWLTGGPGPDVLSSDAGNDTVDAGSGDDFVSSGSGDDEVEGGDNPDQLFGEFGDDAMNGGSGADQIGGGPGADLLGGDGENDSLSGGPGADTMRGGTGDDIMSGDADNDDLDGEEDNDSMSGGDGTDRMRGNSGNDEMHGDDGQDDMEGNEGADTMSGGPGADAMIGGTSTVGTPDSGDSMSGGDAPDVMVGDNGTIAGTTVTLLDLNPIGDDDVMHGNAGPDLLYGGPGNDEMHGNDGDDYMEGNNDADTMTGDAGADRMIGGTSIAGIADGNDTMDGDDAIDHMIGDNGVIPITGTPTIMLFEVPFLHQPPPPAGTSGDDAMSGGAAPDVMYGQSGNDEMHGNDGDDYMEGNAGADTMTGDGGEDDMLGGNGRDTGSPGSGRSFANVLDDNVNGSGDVLSGGDAVDYILGDNGLIRRVGGTHAYNGSARRQVILANAQVDDPAAFSFDLRASGDDTISSDSGDDVIAGQGGNDTIDAGPGHDYVEGNHDNDVIRGGPGQDDLIGGGASNLGDLTDGSGNVVGGNPTGLFDGDDVIYGEGDSSDGTAEGDGADYILADNGSLARPLTDGGLWQTNTFNGSIVRRVWLGDIDRVDEPPVSGVRSGADAIWGNDNDDVIYGQGDNDQLHGGAGNDYLEGNAGSDLVHGNEGEDDMLGGSGPVASDSQLGPVTPLDLITLESLRDASASTRQVPLGSSAAATVPLGDTMYGGDGADEMLGDNGLIRRSLTEGGQWIVLSYALLSDTDGEFSPLHVTGGATSRVDRVVSMAQTEPGLTAGSDLMFGGPGDDDMYGQFDDGTTPNIGDELHGDDGEDAIAGDQGEFDNRVLKEPSQHIEPRAPFVEDDIFIQGSLFREFRSEQIALGGDDRIRGGPGGDWIHAGAGHDIGNGDDGNDHVFGADGRDVLWGGRHHDHLWGGSHDDFLDVHARVDENPTIPNSCNPLTPADPLHWYAFGFEGGLATANCDGNFEHIDFIYGGKGADAMQANVGDNGPRLGDRLFDWVGVYNLYILCPGTYGAWIITRQLSPSMETFLHALAAGDGAYNPGPDGADSSGANEVAFVFKTDLKDNNNPPYPGTPGHFTCTVDSTTTGNASLELADATNATPDPRSQLSSVEVGDATMAISGTVWTSANANALVDFYAGSECDRSGSVAGKSWIGATAFMTSGDGSRAFLATFNSTMEANAYVMANVVDLSGNSPSFTICAGTNAALDSDGDGCADVKERGPDRMFGGERNPSDAWDFYDVTADQAIDLGDTLEILGTFGYGPGDMRYVPRFDRQASDAQRPWLTAPAAGDQLGIDLQDAILNLQSFGHSCR